MEELSTSKEEEKIIEYFSTLPLRDRLVVYAKIVHGNAFRIHGQDIFELNKRIVSRIYRSFLEEMRKRLDPRNIKIIKLEEPTSDTTLEE
jgi:hypothetical protein